MSRRRNSVTSPNLSAHQADNWISSRSRGGIAAVNASSSSRVAGLISLDRLTVVPPRIMAGFTGSSWSWTAVARMLLSKLYACAR
jgi:hypothetical protein